MKGKYNDVYAIDEEIDMHFDKTFMLVQGEIATELALIKQGLVNNSYSPMQVNLDRISKTLDRIESSLNDISNSLEERKIKALNEDDSILEGEEESGWTIYDVMEYIGTLELGDDDLFILSYSGHGEKDNGALMTNASSISRGRMT